MRKIGRGSVRKNWEQGSDFHLVFVEKEEPKSSPWSKNCLWGGSGRDVLKRLLTHGMQEQGWKRLWVPAYFCQDVNLAITACGIDVAVYPYGPEDRGNPLLKMDCLPGDVLLIVNFFGISKQIQYGIGRRKLAAVIEDHTHDPWSGWSWSSDADWCFASLRKVLPLSDGGVLWSPRQHRMPPSRPFTRQRRDASLERLAGMALKGLYLGGCSIDKEIYRRLLISGEESIASGDPSDISAWAKSLLSTFPIDRWRGERRKNHLLVRNRLSGLPWLSVLGTDDEGGCPFSAILRFDTAERRDFVYRKLIRNRIYPAILWPLEKPAVTGIPDRYISLSRRLLSIHCDMRYDESDMDYVASRIIRHGDEFDSDARF